MSVQEQDVKGFTIDQHQMYVDKIASLAATIDDSNVSVMRLHYPKSPPYQTVFSISTDKHEFNVSCYPDGYIFNTDDFGDVAFLGLLMFELGQDVPGLPISFYG